MRQQPFRNVFVLCTGRCGSTTFAAACSHMTNWTAGHESRSHLLGLDRLAYPPLHIEADNRLSWMLGRLQATYGADAAYVHLTRDPEAVARSYARRAAYGIMHAYYHGIVFPAPGPAAPRPVLPHARDMVATVTANIDAFLADKPHVLRLRMEEAAQAFPRFWDWVGAEGRLDLALQEWSIRHNETAPVGAERQMGRIGTWPRQLRRALRLSPGPRAG
jgi:hypothetical protein